MIKSLGNIRHDNVNYVEGDIITEITTEQAQLLVDNGFAEYTEVVAPEVKLELSDMKRPQLEQIAGEAGIDFKAKELKSNKALIEAIQAQVVAPEVSEDELENDTPEHIEE